ncbi:MAG: hypothetical protein U0235_16075 [Polyangiaceae bacterium]
MRRRFVAPCAVALTVIACSGARATEPVTPAPHDVVEIDPCRLRSAVVSEDPCASDADCAPATPCHAHACVAKAKATPRQPNAGCTLLMDCASVDANDCRCHGGRCALVPR